MREGDIRIVNEVVENPLRRRRVICMLLQIECYNDRPRFCELRLMITCERGDTMS